MGDIGQAYAGTRERITGLVDDRPGCEVTIVPACRRGAFTTSSPTSAAWSTTSSLAGSTESPPSRGSAGRRVEAWREASMSELIGDWAAKAPQVGAMVDGFGRTGRQLVADVVIHEHDPRGT